MLKKVFSKRYGDKLKGLSWYDVYDADFPMMMKVVDLFNCLPPTSVSCETTFSQLKLIKTSRRTRLRSSTLNDLLVVKLLSPSIEDFDPEPSIDQWMSSSLRPRRLTSICIEVQEVSDEESTEQSVSESECATEDFEESDEFCDIDFQSPEENGWKLLKYVDDTS